MMISYEADDSQYQSISLLGQCFNELALVHLARHIPSGTLVAVKKFNMDKVKEESPLIQHEIILTRQLQHPNILPYLTTFVSGPDVCVVAPLMAYGSCRDLIVNHFNKGLPEQAIAYIMRDILQGLDYIHRKGFIHRAIRASHILISVNGKACLTGLRYACHIVENGKWQRQIHSFPSSTAVNLNWLSPEVLEQNLQGYNEKSDIYSVGVTCCELANGVVPFANMPTTLMLTEKVRGNAPHILDQSTVVPEALESEGVEMHPLDTGTGDTNGPSCSNVTGSNAYANRRFTEQFHQLTEQCLERKFEDRPSAAQLISHPYFKYWRRTDATLPDLLHPVMPINDQIANDTDDWEAILAAEKMQDLDIHTCEWDF